MRYGKIVLTEFDFSGDPIEGCLQYYNDTLGYYDSSLTLRTLAIGSSSTTTFLGLTDTPAAYASQAGKLVRVAAGETALEFLTPPYYTPSGIDVAIIDGGTGQSTAQAAINALSAVAVATNEHVLTKDTGTGDAVWKINNPPAIALLDGSKHSDTAANAVALGSLIYGLGATPKWSALAFPATPTGKFIQADATNLAWSAWALPASVGSTGQFLKYDGTWDTPAGGSPLAAKGDLYTYTTVDDRLAVGTTGHVLIADPSTTTGLNWKARAPLHEQTWQLMAENVSTDNMLVSHKRGALYSAADGSLAPTHTSTWDTTNHKSTANYSEIAVSTNVTYVNPSTFFFTTAGYVAFFMNIPIVANATSAVITVRLRRVGSNATDSQTVIKVSLSDNDGANPFLGSKLVSAIGTTWEDLTTGGCDLTAGPSITSQTWQISMYSLAAPTASANSKTTVQVDSIKVEQY